MKLREIINYTPYTSDIDVIRDGKLIAYHDGLTTIEPEYMDEVVIGLWVDADKKIICIEVK